MLGRNLAMPSKLFHGLSSLFGDGRRLAELRGSNSILAGFCSQLTRKLNNSERKCSICGFYSIVLAVGELTSHDFLL